MRGHLGPRDRCMNKLVKGPLGMQCFISNFKHLSKVVLKKKIFLNIFYVFLSFHPRTPVAGPSWTLWS